MRESHPFKPIANSYSRLLILGSFPSIASFEHAFYYAHKRNQFWPLMEKLFDCSLMTIPEKYAFCLERGVALWDVYSSTVRAHNNSSDTNLKECQCNDIEHFLSEHKNIQILFFTGLKAATAFKKCCPLCTLPTFVLPSPSPAYAAMSFEEKLLKYEIIKSYAL